ncbi:MAG: M24 family metallopeptidase C-terminal domain-containing protein, partial [Haliea sp.]|nr:M24 family metallopeptidase C-terminal domain-containing protein [Haliea sp.]
EGTLETPMYVFDALTLVPFDRRLIACELLSAGERAWVDAYHQRVLATVGPLLPSAEQAWLEHACTPLAGG